jgi:hypothetical protein
MRSRSQLLRIALIGGLVSMAGSAQDDPWDALLKKYVSAESRVNYAAWKAMDAATLDAYVARLAQICEPVGKAELVNAYNAFTIRWILRNYPVRSIWETKKPFNERRHLLGGKQVSLDEIEKRLRAMGDPRIHATVVCAARSCPPLRREAYTAARLDAQLDDNARAWLSRPDLNQFFPERHAAEVSMIFKWYRKDFDSVPQFLSRYGPPGSYTKIDYKPYHWGLNDIGDLGKDYTNGEFVRAKIRSVFQ